MIDYKKEEEIETIIKNNTYVIEKLIVVITYIKEAQIKQAGMIKQLLRRKDD